MKRDEEAGRDLKPEEALNKIKNQLAQLRKEYSEAKQTLEEWFREHEHEHEGEHENQDEDEDWLGVDDNIRGYGCDGLMNCVDGVTWNWPKPSL